MAEGMIGIDDLYLVTLSALAQSGAESRRIACCSAQHSAGSSGSPNGMPILSAHPEPYHPA